MARSHLTHEADEQIGDDKHYFSLQYKATHAKAVKAPLLKQRVAN